VDLAGGLAVGCADFLFCTIELQLEELVRIHFGVRGRHFGIPELEEFDAAFEICPHRSNRIWQLQNVTSGAPEICEELFVPSIHLFPPTTMTWL
jgi:hypothetical protein